MASALCYQIVPVIAIWYATVGYTKASYDEYMSCSRDFRESRTFRLIPHIPCDMKDEWWCASPGTQYPMDTMKRFVYENQGLMKRMYGDERHINIMRKEMFAEFTNNVPDDDLIPQKRSSKRLQEKQFRKEFRNLKHYAPKKKVRSNSNRAVTISVDDERPNLKQTGSAIKLKYKTSSASNFSPFINSTTDNYFSTLTNASTDSFSPTSEVTEATQTTEIHDNNDFNTNIPTLFESMTSETMTEDPNDKTTKSFDQDSPYLTTTDIFETEDFPPLDADEWNDKDAVDSYAYVTSEVTSSSAAPVRENNRVLTSESLSTYSTFSTSSITADSQKENVIPLLEELVTKDTYSSTTSSEGLKLEERVEPVIHEDLLEIRNVPEKIKQKITAALGNQKVNIQLNTGSRNDDTEDKYQLETDTKSTTEQEPISNRSSPEDQDNTGASIQSSSINRNPSFSSNHKSNQNKHHHGNVDKSNTNKQQHFKPGHYHTNIPQRKNNDQQQPNKPTIQKTKFNHQQQAQSHGTQVRPPPPPPPEPTIQYPVGVNACPIKEEWVAPYWANNTKGELRALLNIYPFEQYVHYERCMHEHRQMYCRRGCRCEQQYRLHRLLALDPNNECRGIFSDWFRFPSCCVCKCYDLPQDIFSTRKSRVNNFQDSGDFDDYDDGVDEDIYEEENDDEEQHYFDAVKANDAMDVDGVGGGYQRPYTPKANVRPQKSPRRYPRPTSHIAPPSGILIPPPVKIDKELTKSSYSSIQDDRNPRANSAATPRPISGVTLGTVNGYRRPFIHNSKFLKGSLSRAPRSTNITSN